MQKRPALGFAALIVLSGAAVLFAFKTQLSGVQQTQSIATSTALTSATSTVPKPTAAISTPAATSTPAPVVHHSSGQTLEAYLTGYAWPDNTPPGSAISHPVIHQEAGGTGTYVDPITVAVGHSNINGQDITDYPAGTKFYMPYLRKYFIAEDTCGDGDTPQDVPCHNLHMPGNEAPAGAEVWLDLWVGGVGSAQSVVLTCEDAITGLHPILIKPSANYTVNPGAIYGTSCAAQFSDTALAE